MKFLLFRGQQPSSEPNPMPRRPRKWTVLAGIAVLLVCAVTILQIVRAPGPAAMASVTDWGLSFQAEGAPPVGNASASELAQYGAYYVGDATQPVIYLTFDAGYESGDTPAILDALKKHNAPACFFVVSNYIESAPELVQRMVSEGHLVGNHTATHPDMSQIADADAFAAELRTVEEQFSALTGQELPKFYRPPQGKYSVENLQQAQALGYTTVFWSLAYVDWYADNQPTAEQAFQKLIPRIHNGAILLLHSTSHTNAQILDELLTRYEDLGYRFGSLTELTQQNDG